MAKKKTTSSRGVRLSKTKVTPTMAARWLDTTMDNGFTNRNLRHHIVDLYARDMIEGKWADNGETVKFDNAGNVVDGQHRLWAVVQADKDLPNGGIKMSLAYGVDDADLLTVDNGIPRQFYDHLNFKGIINSRALATAIRFQLAWETHKTPFPSTGGKGNNRWRPSFNELERCFNRNKKLSEAISHSTLRPQMVSKGILGWFIFNITKIDQELAEEFMEDLAEGAGLEKKDPVHALRRRLLANTTTTGTKRLRGETIAAYLVKAWNARMRSQPVNHYKYLPGEDFPTFVKP
jgi:hypothetical protein